MNIDQHFHISAKHLLGHENHWSRQTFGILFLFLRFWKISWSLSEEVDQWVAQTCGSSSSGSRSWLWSSWSSGPGSWPWSWWPWWSSWSSWSSSWWSKKWISGSGLWVIRPHLEQKQQLRQSTSTTCRCDHFVFFEADAGGDSPLETRDGIFGMELEVF